MSNLKFRFDLRQFIISIILLVVLVLIALFVRDRFIRPIFGDFLVVIFMYYFIAAFVQLPKHILAIGVLIFAYAVEIGQYFNLVEHLGLKGNRFAEIVIGMGFTWTDMLAYTLGVALVYYIERSFSPTATLTE